MIGYFIKSGVLLTVFYAFFILYIRLDDRLHPYLLDGSHNLSKHIDGEPAAIFCGIDTAPTFNGGGSDVFAEWVNSNIAYLLHVERGSL